MQRNRLALFGVFMALALGPVPAVAHPERGAYGPPGRGAYGPPLRGAYESRPIPPPRPAHDEQNEARREMRAGNIHLLRDIERRVLPTMPGMQYLGPEYDPDAMAYRLKFIRNGRVVFVDVDARSGRLLGRTR
jgi:hypothetical protein